MGLEPRNDGSHGREEGPLRSAYGPASAAVLLRDFGSPTGPGAGIRR